MIKPDSRRWTHALESVGVGIVIGGAWIFGGMNALLVIYILLFSGCIREARTFRRLKQLEVRRQAAAAFPANDAMLAALQPTPDAEALPFPCSSIQRTGWLTYIVAPLLIWISLITFPLLLSRESYNSRFLAITLAFALLFATLAQLSSGQQLVVREDGLTVTTPMGAKTIRWDEARLFAIVGGARRTGSPGIYELSSATVIVRWQRVAGPSHFAWLRPSFPEYERQMEALLAFITAKTNLPLYDVR